MANTGIELLVKEIEREFPALRKKPPTIDEEKKRTGETYISRLDLYREVIESPKNFICVWKNIPKIKELYCDILTPLCDRVGDIRGFLSDLIHRDSYWSTLNPFKSFREEVKDLRRKYGHSTVTDIMEGTWNIFKTTEDTFGHMKSEYEKSRKS